MEKFHESTVKYTVTAIDFSYFFKWKNSKFNFCPFSNEETESQDG